MEIWRFHALPFLFGSGWGILRLHLASLAITLASVLHVHTGQQLCNCCSSRARSNSGEGKQPGRVFEIRTSTQGRPLSVFLLITVYIYTHDITPFSILVCRVVERVLQKPLGTPPQRIICMRRSSKIMRDLISKIKLMFGGWISLATPQHLMRRDLVMAVGCGHSGNWIQCHRRWLGPLFPVPDAFPSKRLSTHI